MKLFNFIHKVNNNINGMYSKAEALKNTSEILSLFC